jgi:Na+-transporting methylmalonyl-CoA/oxaloacetate decarboxylase gamma subunit
MDPIDRNILEAHEAARRAQIGVYIAGVGVVFSLLSLLLRLLANL